MKTALSLLALLATISFGHAGGFGGPPPFTNGSPLTTGVNGSYQASVRGDNLSGIIAFQYSDGTQSSGVGGTVNRWVIFFEGQVFSGTPAVNIMDGSISGVLDGNATTPVTITNSTSDTRVATSYNVTVQSTAPNGYFTGTLDNNSTSGFFKGNGELGAVVTTTTTNVSGPNTITTREQSAQNVPFRVKGVRVAYPTS